MKTKDIQRGIESPLRRKSGDSPRLGQVTRLRHSHVPTSGRSGRSGRRREEVGRRVGYSLQPPRPYKLVNNGAALEQKGRCAIATNSGSIKGTIAAGSDRKSVV